MRTHFTLLACLLSLLTFAQPNAETDVFGVVVERSTGEPMEFVDVVLHNNKNDEFLDGVTTNENGGFRFTNIAPGEYYVKTNFMGYEPRRSRVFSIDGKNQPVDLKELPIEISVSLLEEVEVTAKKTTLNIGLDRRTYNVDADIMSQTSSVTDILQNLPSVTLDVNGQVSLRGTSNITYLVNGRPSALLRAGGAAALQQIPASSIERIEVITNPSAKYRPDGIGGIINIVTKEASGQGLNGSVQINGGNPGLELYNANILLNYGKEDVNFFGSYGIRHANTPQDITDRRLDREGGVAVNSFTSVSDVTFGELSHLATAGVTFPLGEAQVEIAGEYFYLNNDNNSFTKWNVTEDDAPSLFDVGRQYNGYEQEYDVGIAYEREFENEDHALAVEFNYSGYDETEDNLYDEMYRSPFTDNIRSRNLIEKGGPVMEFVVEYARPVGRESEIEVGYLGEVMKDDINILGENFLNDENQWITDPLKTYRFKFNQTLHAGYGVFTQAIESFYYSAGLRAEQALVTSNLVSDGQKIKNNYFNLFPTLALGLELGDNEEIQLSYSKRINRADPDEQNPFPEYDDPRTRDKGNPRLRPEQVHSVELGYRLQNEKFTFMPTLYYRYLYDGFTEFREIVADSILETTFTNFSNQTMAGAEVIFKGNVSNFLDLNFSANAFYNELDGTNLGLPANQSQITWDTKLGASMSFSKTTYAQLNAQYISSRLTPQGEFQPIVLLNLGFRQDIWDRKASVHFTVSDVFASVEWESRIDNPNLFWNTIYGRNQQIFYLGFSYRFGETYAKRRQRKQEKLEFDDVIEVPNPVPNEEEEEE